jgi:DNA-binding beta-propeller fold protein YncE
MKSVSYFRRRSASVTSSLTCRRLLCGLLALLVVAPLRADTIELVAGGERDAVGIPATEARLREPFGTAFDTGGNLFIVEMAAGNRLLRMDAAGVLTHVAGTGKAGFSGDGGPALAAEFNGPHNLAVLPDGNVLISDTWAGRVRKVDVKAGTVTSLPGYEVPLDKARGNGPYCITLDATGTKLYIADLLTVSELDLATGGLRVVAGNGRKGRPEDGAIAVEAPLVDPRAVAPDRRGNLYILERGGNALRVVGPDGRIRTVVNASGAKGATGDGGPAAAATMNGPKHLCVDLADDVLIADAENDLVRKYSPATGTITRVAGTGKHGRGKIGRPPLECDLARPHGVTVDRTGTLFITDSYNDRILKIVKDR